MQTTNDLLETYKRHPFAHGLLPFQAALRALATPFPRIYIEQEGRQRWVVYDKKTKQPALFSHAAVLAASDDEETGNYVPQGEEVPLNVEAKSNRPNSKCFYTYIFDTFADISLYEGQWTLDDLMRGVSGFNPVELERRSYLSGREPKFRNRFWMQTPMFLRRGPQEARLPAPTHLHPWIVRGDQESKVFRANPDRPRVWEKVDEEILPIGERGSKNLQRGDVVGVSFTVTYHLTSVNWFAQFHPADIVLLKTSDGDATDYSAPALNLHNRPPPSFHTGQVAEG
ncbi:hypothetical protein LXA43DRAFT_905156 [Ganoderma leucocontextum]|nr:hypothetical protein LXA43DRAFT_905156 [Ganoderma leucocontextum]